ncbi:hypothetical protein CBL_02842 [Carabus blaptoides fortunei]
MEHSVELCTGAEILKNFALPENLPKANMKTISVHDFLITIRITASSSDDVKPFLVATCPFLVVLTVKATRVKQLKLSVADNRRTPSAVVSFVCRDLGVAANAMTFLMRLIDCSCNNKDIVPVVWKKPGMIKFYTVEDVSGINMNHSTRLTDTAWRHALLSFTGPPGKNVTWRDQLCDFVLKLSSVLSPAWGRHEV